MQVAYVVNHYPAVSHTFIRREILALESLGFSIHRLGVRGWDDALLDPADIDERTKTFYLLRLPLARVLSCVALCLCVRPVSFFRALGQWMALTRVSDRGLRCAAYFVEACIVADYVRKSRIRHIHAHFGTNSTDVALLAATLAQIPFSFTVHGPEEFDRAHSLSLRRKMERAKFVVAISFFTRSQLWRMLPMTEWNKIIVVRCGMTVPATHESNGVIRSARFLHVGRLVEQKGQAVLLHALGKLRARGILVALDIIGDGPLRSSLEKLAAALRVEADVTFHGAKSGDVVLERMQSCKAVVLPSFAEGLPVVIVEAFCVQRPVISTWVAGIPELVDHSCGWLVPAGDVDSLAVALENCLKLSTEELDAMGAVGTERVRMRHDLITEVSKLAAAMKSANSDSPKGL